jgi:hypothetical protein
MLQKIYRSVKSIVKWRLELVASPGKLAISARRSITVMYGPLWYGYF